MSIDDSSSPPLAWGDLAAGTPSIIGLAALCARALATGATAPPLLSREAQAILHAARERCTIEIKAAKNAYDSSQRLLAVHVELGPERLLAFRSRQNPKFTLAILGGFAELCAAGLVMHHLGHEFSLTRAGIAAAADVRPELVADLLANAVEIDFET